MTTHTGERPFECTHVDCGMRFATATHLKRHSIVHERTMPFMVRYRSRLALILMGGYSAHILGVTKVLSRYAACDPLFVVLTVPPLSISNCEDIKRSTPASSPSPATSRAATAALCRRANWIGISLFIQTKRGIFVPTKTAPRPFQHGHFFKYTSRWSTRRSTAATPVERPLQPHAFFARTS